jgi:hypothetical protein
MTREVGEDIGMEVGQLLEVDVPNENGIAWGRFLRIHVEVEIAKPLMRGCIVQVEDDKPVWVDFRYEHLPIFCYKCGCLGHSSSDCFASRGSSRVSVFDRDQYGSWLRALPVCHYQVARRQTEVGEGTRNYSNSNFHEEVGSGGGGDGALEPPRGDRQGDTSAENNDFQTVRDRGEFPDYVELVDTEKEVLHVPTFMDVQLGESSSGKAGVDKDRDMELEAGTAIPTLVKSYDRVEKISGKIVRIIQNAWMQYRWVIRWHMVVHM